MTRLTTCYYVLSRAVTPRRRQTILQRDFPPRLLLSDEMVLRREIGDSNVMREQLGRLIFLAEQPNITLQVVEVAVAGWRKSRHSGGDSGDRVEVSTVFDLVSVRDYT
jgi:Domain of unknown function (DUF5753)/Domain of unknown function (DUF397)